MVTLLYFENSFLKIGYAMIFQFLLVGLILVVAFGVIYKLAKKEVDNKLMLCPNCHSNRIYPETDSVWGCMNCNSFFSANYIL